MAPQLFWYHAILTDMNERVIKQLTIAFVFIILVIGISYSVGEVFTEDPTCYDQQQNQNEEGIDCGAVCNNSCEPDIVPLEVLSAELISQGDGDFDFVGRVRNPNTIHGASNVSYELILRAADGSEVQRINGSFYMLPVQTKYVVKTPLKNEGATAVDMVIKDAVWNKVGVADLKIDFPLIREQHGTVALPGVRYQIEGVIENRSDFDFDTVDVVVILENAANSIAAVTTTTINTFISDTERYFKVTWPTTIPEDSLTPYVQASTNVFRNSNFIRRYGTQEEFQRYD